MAIKAVANDLVKVVRHVDGCERRRRARRSAALTSLSEPGVVVLFLEGANADEVL
jgi:hypothetical protein